MPQPTEAVWWCINYVHGLETCTPRAPHDDRRCTWHVPFRADRDTGLRELRELSAARPGDTRSGT